MCDLLPTELLELLFCFLTYPEKVVAQGVCRRWRAVLEQYTGPPSLLVRGGHGLAAREQYLLGQYNILPDRINGRAAYQQENTVGKEHYYLYSSASMTWHFSHMLGASDGRYPVSFCKLCTRSQECRSYCQPGARREVCQVCPVCTHPAWLPPARGWSRGADQLEVVVPGQLEPAARLELLLEGEMDRLHPDIAGEYLLEPGVWSCGRPVYGKGMRRVMVTGRHWTVKVGLHSWGEVELRLAGEAEGSAHGDGWERDGRWEDGWRLHCSCETCRLQMFQVLVASKTKPNL